MRREAWRGYEERVETAVPARPGAVGRGFRHGCVGPSQFLKPDDGLGLNPTMLSRLSQAAPPDFIGKAERPRRMSSGQPDQAVAPFFFLR